MCLLGTGLSDERKNGPNTKEGVVGRREKIEIERKYEGKKKSVLVIFVLRS